MKIRCPQNSRSLLLMVLVGCCINQVGYAAEQSVAEISGFDTPFQLNRLIPFGMGNTADKDLCVYSSTGAYQVIIRGDGPSQQFVAVLPGNPAAKTISYQVFWNNHAGVGGNFQLQTGQISPVLVQSGNTNCTTANGNQGYWANLQVTIPDAQLQGAYAGSYIPSLKIDITAVAQLP